MPGVSEPLTTRELLTKNGFSMPPQPATFLYQVGLALVAIAMVLLPVVYWAITAAVGYGVYFFATHYFVSIWHWPLGGRYGFAIKALCSVTPMFAGGIIAIFMFKPLLSRRPKQMQPITLNPEHEPLFHQYVHQICAIIGAPAPREIRLDCAVNASAGFRRGYLSFFGNDLVLTLGMPLLAGLTTQELAGVIAHEFGHFRQGAAMRLSYLIRRVNLWFARVIYERGSWDEWLVSFSQADDWWLSVMGSFARFGVWLSRCVLMLLNCLGHAISSFLMRQMEFDADRCGVYLAGAGAFESTTLRIAELSDTTRRLYHDMKRGWRKAFQVPDNLPLLIVHRANAISEERRAAITGEVIADRTKWSDSHPAPVDRIAAARQLGFDGVLRDDTPAADLLENFATLAKFVTLAHYEDDLEIPTTPDFLIPVEHIINPPKPLAEVEPVPVFQAPQWRGIPATSIQRVVEEEN